MNKKLTKLFIILLLIFSFVVQQNFIFATNDDNQSQVTEVAEATNDEESDTKEKVNNQSLLDDNNIQGNEDENKEDSEEVDQTENNEKLEQDAQNEDEQNVIDVKTDQVQNNNEEKDIKDVENNDSQKKEEKETQNQLSQNQKMKAASKVSALQQGDEEDDDISPQDVGEMTAQDLKAELESGKNVTLTNDIVYNLTTVNTTRIEKDVTLDLNGYTITVVYNEADTANKDSLFYVIGGSFTLIDSNGNHDGKTTVSYQKATVDSENKPVVENNQYVGGVITGEKHQVFNVDGGTVNLNGGCIYNNGQERDEYNGGAVSIYNSATLNLNGALLVGNKGSWGGAIEAKGDSTVNIFGNTIISGNTAYRRGGGIYATNSAKINMNEIGRAHV